MIPFREFAQALIAADQVIAGKVLDPTSGATHYYATTMPAAPVWAAKAKQLAEQAGLHKDDLTTISNAAAALVRADQDKRLALEQRLSASEQTYYAPSDILKRTSNTVSLRRHGAWSGCTNASAAS